MKERPAGFLGPKHIDHASEQFDYITELHCYLWRFIRSVNPGASGHLGEFLDAALVTAEKRRDAAQRISEGK